MRFHDWINNIRWKYFTNNKSGLIFKELTKEFRIVYKMTENKRYTTDNGSNEDVCLVDNVTGKEFESDFDEIVDLLNEQEEEIQELKQTIDTIAKDYEESHGMDIRNAEWFTAW